LKPMICSSKKDNETQQVVPVFVRRQTTTEKCCHLCTEWSIFVEADRSSHGEEKNNTLRVTVPAIPGGRHGAERIATECDLTSFE